MASRLKEDVVINKNNENEDLLVFGYSCKLFRNDEKALFIDQGKHLIPWMGDESLKIDRYDARGTLYDLKQAEAPSGGFDRFFGLTDMEKQVESMCDEERYRALIANEEEETMYQEEELKRLHYAIGDKANAYGQVEYKYDGEENFVEENLEKPQIEKATCDGGDDEPFVPSPQLDLPLNMIVPETVKHNAIIEKTAMFINNQGPQMEILLKMKQAGNPQFNFLSFDNPLHSYYRHLLMAIKGGRYNPEFENSNKKQENENDEDSHYLHPSLSSVSKVELAPSIPSINYKPSAHCAYSMLVNKIKDKKSGEHGTHLSKLKEALERLKDDKGTENVYDGVRNCPSGNQNSNAQAFTSPPKDMQIIIDKMASYVAKNGRDFETVVQMKNDPRFDFLNANHVFNLYYQFKIKQYENLEKSAQKPQAKINAENANNKLKDEQSKNKLAPVCFSIKKPKDSEPVIEKSALPVEESSDEEGKDEKKQAAEEKEKEGKEEVVTIDLAAIEEKEEKNKKILAAERLKDKLTTAAREKVAMATKEKQLQLERKRRAAAFLKAINSEGKSPAPVCGPQLPGEGIDREAEAGESDVASLPDAPDLGWEEKAGEARHKRGKFPEERRHRSSSHHFRHKRREKRKAKSSDASTTEKPPADDDRGKEANERVMDSSSSSDEDLKRKGIYSGKTSKTEEAAAAARPNKSFRSRAFRSDEKRHKKKKHKKDATLDRSSRKYSKLKREKRSGNDEDRRAFKSKRSRRGSTSSSDQKS